MPKVDFTKAMDRRKTNASYLDNRLDVDRSYNGLFGLPVEKEAVTLLPVASLREYNNDPFQDRSGAEADLLAASIYENGLLNPIIVRPTQEHDIYEILAGRRRVKAVKQNGGTEIEAIIRNADDDTAVMIVTETNLRSREKLLPSEKAFAYKLQLDVIKRQGKRTDLELKTSTQFARKMESAEIIAANHDVSKDEIRRYIRLTNLISPLLELVDTDQVPFIAAVNLSYLNSDAQKKVYAYFFEHDYGVKLDLKLSVLLRAAFKEKGELTEVEIEALCLNKQQSVQPRSFSINRKKLQPYLDKLPVDEELECLFLEFLESRFGGSNT